jgi:amidase
MTMRPKVPSNSPEKSAAFIEQFALAPTGNGTLDGLTFAVKDIIDVAGRRSGCGNPRWPETHPPAAVHAVCVEQLLAAGARCVGKTVTDELAFSLLGENPHDGTPLNPSAPERVPGGSSSGSASAVACGLVDFALGSDTGGSVRVPASNCGIFGLRPSHGRISVAGVMPFAPTFDTIGLFARRPALLARSASVLLGCDCPDQVEVGTIYLLPETFALCTPQARRALRAPLAALRRAFTKHVLETSIHCIDQTPEDVDLRSWYETFCVLQWCEIWSCLGAWVQEAKPALGPEARENFELVKNLERSRVLEAARRRERYARELTALLGPDNLLCIPTAPAPAPWRGVAPRRSQPGGEYYPRALALCALAGIGRLPQVSVPAARCAGAPLGLSLVAAHGADAFLLSAVQQVAGALAG